MLARDWSLVEAGSPVPRDRGRAVPRSPCRPNMNACTAPGDHMAWLPGLVHRGEDATSAPPPPRPHILWGVPAEPRKASWRWSAGRNW